MNGNECRYPSPEGKETSCAGELADLYRILVKAHRENIETAKALKDLVRVVERLGARVDRLQGSLRASRDGTRQARDVQRAAYSESEGIDRYKWGRMVATSQGPRFDSREFAREFRRPLPIEALATFDSVRLKKILQRLCNEGVIENTKPGRGRTPAQYRVLVPPRRDRARG